MKDVDKCLDTATKVQSRDEIIDKLNFIKMENFCCEKAVTENQKTSHRMVKTICKHRPDKDCYSKCTTNYPKMA